MPSAVEHSIPRVSVLIPTYNRAEYLCQALASVADQSLTPWEVIVVDDGSTDDTAGLVASFESSVHYIRHEQNQGISAARNSGLQAARGELIAWLDADDLWEPNFLATVIPLIEADEGVDAVYTGLMRIDADNNLLPHSSQRVVPPSELHAALVQDCFIQISTLVARKSCYDRVGPFDPQFSICEDYDMFLRLAETCTIVGLPAYLVRYRVHPQNTVANVSQFCRSRLALTRKYFGEATGDPETWSADKRRAHGHMFRAVAFKYVEAGQSDEAWRYLQRAVTVWPPLLGRLDTYYELACGDQPMGHRGYAKALDIEANGRSMLNRLDTLFSTAGPALRSLHGQAYGNAYLALGMLSDQAGDWKAARYFLLRGVMAHPRLMSSYSVVRRLLKLCAGQKLVRMLRHRQQASNATGVS